MGTYRLLALDMDGTLLTSAKEISPATIAALGRARERGVFCALSTGRALSELADYRCDLEGVVRYASLLNGSEVADLEDGRVLETHPIPEELVHAIASQGLRENAMVQLFTATTAVMTHADVARMPEIGQGAYQALAYSYGHLVDGIEQFLEQNTQEILKINLHHVDAASHARSKELLGHLPLEVVTGESATCEITAEGITKACGLEQLCRLLAIGASEVAYVGDAENDLRAFAAAGTAFAMGNAEPMVREAADVVVADNDHDGIAQVVDHILSRGPASV